MGFIGGKMHTPHVRLKNMMKNYTKQDLLLMINFNNLVQPKAKYSNACIERMLECLPNDFTATLEETKSGAFVNRGSLVECIVKSVIYGVSNIEKSKQKDSDLNTLKLDSKHLNLVNGIKSSNIEIKFTTSFAPATAKHNKAHKVILVCDYGIFMIDSKNIVATKAGKINVNNQRSTDLTPLNDLMDLLGY